MNTAIFLPFLCLVLGWSVVVAKGEAPDVAAIDERVKGFVSQHEISGAVTLVANRQGVVHLGAVGQADLEGARAMTPDAIFWIASMTKPVTATALMMLEEEGKLSIDDPVNKYIPELAGLKMADGTAPVITLKHCLTHSSGMSDVAGPDAKEATKLADLIPHIVKQPLRFAPGSKWEYNQSGINVLGRTIEVVSGMTLPEFFEKRIFGPLGMKDTTFYLSAEQSKRLAKSYLKDGDKLTEAKVFILEGHGVTEKNRYPAANGGLFSTAGDYGRFFQMILNEGTLDGKQYLKAETVKKMTSVQSGDLKTGFTPGHAWGLGWCVVREPQGVTAMLSPGSCGHGGAYGTQAWIDPEKGLVFVLMVQRANFPNSDDSVVRKGFQEAAVAAVKK